MVEKKETVSIMDIDFLKTTQKIFLQNKLLPNLKNKEKCFVVTANPEIVMKTREDAEYKRIVQSADYVIADGIGIVKAASWKGDPLPERVAGFDVMLDLLKAAEEEGFSCYFLGAEELINEKAVEEVKSRFPKLQIAGRHHGFFELNNSDIVEEVKTTNPDIVFVALGLPRQELWIGEHLNTFNKGIFMGVGGSFDVLAGAVKRAPAIWIKLNLEWAYRVLKQPSRLFRILKVMKFMLIARFK